MASKPVVVLPGDVISLDTLPLSAKKQIKLGPGLRHQRPSTIKATISGNLSNDGKKNALWVEHSSGRYIPSTGDLVIVTVQRSALEHHICNITPHTSPALLPQLAFENATKKTRPLFDAGALIYARISSASKHADTELECINPATGKADGLGLLKGGMVWDISLGFARRMMIGKRGGVVLLEELSRTIAFEVAIGRNGKVWVHSDDDFRITIAVGRAIAEVDEQFLTVQQQAELAKRVLKGLQ